MASKIRSKIVEVKNISEAERLRLGEQCFAVYSDRITFLSRQEFDNIILFAPSVQRIFLLYQNADLVGFSVSRKTIYQVNNCKEHVLSAGAFVKRGHYVGDQLIRFGIVESLKYKLRRPMAEVWFLTQAATPVSYRFFARIMDVYPHPTKATPQRLKQIFFKYVEEHKLSIKNLENWTIVGAPKERYSLPESDRMKKSAKLLADPWVLFYEQINPSFEEGIFVVMAFSLDYKNLLRPLLSQIKSMLLK